MLGASPTPQIYLHNRVSSSLTSTITTLLTSVSIKHDFTHDQAAPWISDHLLRSRALHELHQTLARRRAHLRPAHRVVLLARARLRNVCLGKARDERGGEVLKRAGDERIEQRAPALGGGQEGECVRGYLGDKGFGDEFSVAEDCTEMSPKEGATRGSLLYDV